MLGLFFDAYQNKKATSEPSWTQAWQIWAMPSWDWAQTSDRFENTLANVPALMRQATLSQMEAMLDLQLAFLRRRVHADFDYANAILGCEDVNEAMSVATGYWQQFVGDCEKQSNEVLHLIAEGADHTSEAQEGDAPASRRRQSRRVQAGNSVIPIDRAASAATARDKAA